MKNKGWYIFIGLLVIASAVIVLKRGELISLKQNTPVTDSASAASPDPVQVQLAEQVLTDFFHYLAVKDYDHGVMLYGGDPAMLQIWNPDVNPGDKVTLFKNGCELNGLKCLETESVRFIKPGINDARELHLRVSFRNPDGSKYIQKPCCGSTGTGTDEFDFIVRQNDSGYQVLTLPVYQP